MTNWSQIISQLEANDQRYFDANGSIKKPLFSHFIFSNLKNRVSVKNNDKISVARMFLDPIKNRVSVKSVYVEAVYLEALLYHNEQGVKQVKFEDDHDMVKEMNFINKTYREKNNYNIYFTLECTCLYL